MERRSRGRRCRRSDHCLISCGGAGSITFQCRGFNCTLYEQGLRQYEKLSYPARFGVFHRIKGHGIEVHLNLRCQPLFFQATTPDWPHPHDWIHQTPSGRLLYIASGSYLDAFSLYGQHFIPVPERCTNSVFPHDPFSDSTVRRTIDRLDHWFLELSDALGHAEHPKAKWFRNRLSNAMTHAPIRASRFHSAIRGTVPVLPPDARHAEYNVIPLLISDGCLANCGFCTIKSAAQFRERDTKEIEAQAEAIVRLLGPDLPNFNSVFLGQNDALACRTEIIAHAVRVARSEFHIENSYIKSPMLFMFASTRSLLDADETVFEIMEDSGFICHVNTGFESFHQPTLDRLKKPASSSEVLDAFRRATWIGSRYRNVRVTGNFVIGPSLGEEHSGQLIDTVRKIHMEYGNKAPSALPQIYLSPLAGENGRESLRLSREIQHALPVPSFLYLLAGL